MLRSGPIIAFCLLPLLSGCKKPSPPANCQAVVASIKAGSQVVAPTGEVILPASQTGSVVNGKAYVTTQPTGTMLVLFPTWWGKGTNLRGFLYSNGQAFAVGTTVNVNVPFPSPVSSPQFGLTEVTVEDVLSPGWYSVSRSLD